MFFCVLNLITLSLSLVQGGTILGAPDTVCDLGATQIPFDMFMDYLQDQASSAYK